MTSRRQPDEAMDPLLRAAARQADAAGAAGSCLEPDVIASWADGRLGRDDAAALESHAASCSRCRAVLAAFAQTTPAAPATTPWWKAPVVRWSAPLAAVAGAAIIWVSVDRTIERDREAPAETAVSARDARAEQDTAQPPAAVTAPLAERPEERAQQDTAGARRASPSRQVVDSVKPAPPPPAAPPAAAADERQRARAEAVAKSTALNETLSRAAAAPLELASPDKSIRWRVLPGRIERTADDGETWEPYPVATAAALTTGGCPSSEVCWVAGVAGTVLRTTDGRSWAEVAKPDPSDIVSITPTDALNAVVTMADGRAFITSDGGRTWSRRPLQEDPAAAF